MPYCGPAQINLAKDPESEPYREEDGSILFSSYVQADFAFVPTKYADEFARAARLHLKHKVFIECAYNTVVDMVRVKTGATSRSVDLCTSWFARRGLDKMINMCKGDDHKYGLYHPYKMGQVGYKSWAEMHDLLSEASYE